MREDRAARHVFDVVVAGGGPAGLAAALVLGRCCREVLLCDAGTPRSWASREMHGFVTREGTTPAEFRRIAHAELDPLPVRRWHGEVVDVTRRGDGGFDVALADGRSASGRKLLIATGVMDELPPVPGIDPFWGVSVHHCPYCHGWEFRGAPVAVYGRRSRALEMARAMTAWTRDIALCSDGDAELSARDRSRLARNDVSLFEQKIERLEGRRHQLEAVVFADGTRLPRRALFFDRPSVPQSRLVERLGVKKTKDGVIRRGRYEATSVPGVYVAGNILKDVQLAIVAAAEGTRAAFGINRALTREQFERRATGRRVVEHPPLEDAAGAQR